jgi:uncharacterized protein with PhoU and TrkA domain/ElaB/YqjD/DUF883 family membrane-anchored ribosome-binding protein
MLTDLGVQEGAKLEIINEATGNAVTVTLFADSMVEEGYIRLSTEDLASLGLYEDDTVTIKRKPPISEQIREEAGEAVERVSEGIERVGKEAGEAVERVSEGIEKAGVTVKREAGEAADTVKKGATKAYGRIVEETAPVTDRIEGATKETVARIKEEVTPVTERVEDAAREAYARIAESPLKERLSKAAESFIDRLKPGEEAKLKKVLEQSKGKIQTITVSSDTVADKLIRELELPPEVVISAIQRNKEIIIPGGDARLVKGDIVYVVGKGESLRKCSEMMEG